MTTDPIANAFVAGFPHPVTFHENEKEAAEAVCAQYGYRLAGIRWKQAVFTTKPEPGREAQPPRR